MIEQEREFLEQLVFDLADRPKRKWERLIANWEVEDSEEMGFDHDVYIFTVERGRFGKLTTSDDVEPTAGDFDLVKSLRHLMADRGSAWSTMDLEIDATGEYRVDFDYDPPRRMNGILDERSLGRFERYLETYKNCNWSGQAGVGIQGSPDVSRVRASKKWMPCLRAVAR